jgi:hypothetical protein
MPCYLTFKRRHPRVPHVGPILIKAAGRELPEEILKTRVLGRGGCMFVSPRVLGRGCLVSVALPLGPRVLRAKARVVWERRETVQEVAVGVEFLHLGAQEVSLLETVVPVVESGGF